MKLFRNLPESGDLEPDRIMNDALKLAMTTNELHDLERTFQGSHRQKRSRQQAQLSRKREEDRRKQAAEEKAEAEAAAAAAAKAKAEDERRATEARLMSIDVDTCSVKDLRALIELAGLKHTDCFEKPELRVRANEAKAQLRATRVKKEGDEEDEEDEEKKKDPPGEDPGDDQPQLNGKVDVEPKDEGKGDGGTAAVNEEAAASGVKAGTADDGEEEEEHEDEEVALAV